MINLLHGIENEVTAPSIKGRRVNDLQKSVKVTERGTLRSLPKQKIKPLMQKHSLVEAVRSNKY